MEKYQEKIYHFLTQIPKGKVVTYGQIAKKIQYQISAAGGKDSPCK